MAFFFFFFFLAICGVQIWTGKWMCWAKTRIHARRLKRHTRELGWFWSNSGSKNTISVLSSAARCVPSPAPAFYWLQHSHTHTHTHTHAVCPDLKLLWITACSNKAIIFPTTLPRSVSPVKSLSEIKEALTQRASSRHSRRRTWDRLISDCCQYSPSAPSP